MTNTAVQCGASPRDSAAFILTADGVMRSRDNSHIQNSQIGDAVSHGAGGAATPAPDLATRERQRAQAYFAQRLCRYLPSAQVLRRQVVGDSTATVPSGAPSRRVFALRALTRSIQLALVAALDDLAWFDEAPPLAEHTIRHIVTGAAAHMVTGSQAPAAVPAQVRYDALVTYVVTAVTSAWGTLIPTPAIPDEPEPQIGDIWGVPTDPDTWRQITLIGFSNRSDGTRSWPATFTFRSFTNSSLTLYRYDWFRLRTQWPTFTRIYPPLDAVPGAAAATAPAVARCIRVRRDTSTCGEPS